MASRKCSQSGRSRAECQATCLATRMMRTGSSSEACSIGPDSFSLNRVVQSLLREPCCESHTDKSAEEIRNSNQSHVPGGRLVLSTLSERTWDRTSR
eukprot:134344-Hanusia_phi.AAC.3